MQNNKITIVPKKLQGSVYVPSSKSIAHRVIISSALADGISKVENVYFSDDIYATINAVRAIGATVECFENYLVIKGIKFGTKKLSNISINCNESASTLRFMMPLAGVFADKVMLKTKNNLVNRPLDIYFNIFEEQKIKYYYDEHRNLNIEDSLRSGKFELAGNISSQFASGLLFTLPLLDGDSEIIITSKLQSKPYIDLTLDVLKDYGIIIENHEYEKFIIKGNQRYKPKDYVLEGDFSQSSFFEIANYLGSKVIINNINPNSKQGDKCIYPIIEKIKSKENIVISGENCPDIIPIVALACCFRSNNTVIKNLERLRIKESDRLSATYETLKELGANIEIVNNNELHIFCKYNLDFYGDITLDSYGDHRIAMMIAIAGTKCRHPINLKNYSCVSKSYPTFFKDFKNLGGVIIE